MISVVIPLYNKAHTIVNTLNTVVNQTYKDFEVIIVNDGSTDNGVEVIQHNFTDSRIRIINQKNAGVSAARNKGIKEAKGNYISFLDADDEWMPNYLENINLAIKEYPKAGMIISGRYSQNIKTGKRKANIPSKYHQRISTINFFDNPHVFAHISATTIATNLLKKNNELLLSFIPGQKSNEDFTFLFSIALYTSVIYIGVPLSIYNGEVEDQATNTLKEKQKITDFILFHNKIIEEFHKSHSTNQTFKIFMKYEFRHSILQHLKKKNYQAILYILSMLDSNTKRLLINKIENIIYTKSCLNRIAISYIYITKLIWRTHCFPSVK